MRLEFDDQGYVCCILYGCMTGSCEEYTGTTPSEPEAYTDIDDWANRAETRAYKLDAEGNLIYDAEKAAALANSGDGVNLVGKLLWSGANQMDASQTVTLEEPISKQPTGISLVFSRYSNDAVQNDGFYSFFVSKQFVALHPAMWSTFLMSTVTFAHICSKTLCIEDRYLHGYADNNGTGKASSGITYNNAAYVLRYVFGV